jgi:hypothetical protein
MIKDLLQYKYTSDLAPKYTCLRSPKKTDNLSLMSKAGDPKKNSDKLKFLLLSIKFP